MEADKTYQIYSEAKKQLFEERFQLAQEYLSKRIRWNQYRYL